MREKKVNSYKCFVCGASFKLDRELDTDKPTCNKCFKELLEIKTAKGYLEFIQPTIKERTNNV